MHTRTSRWLAPAAAATTLALLALPTTAEAGPQSATRAAASELPNVVVIVADDQAKGTVDAMPTVRSQLRNNGLEIKTGIIPTSTCCPSRAALLSGKYAHTTRVFANTGRHGGWDAFYSSGAEADTFAVALNKVGYRTAMFGKYLNGFALAPAGYVPPGWDTFGAIWDPDSHPSLAAGAYYDYVIRGTEPDESYGSAPADYSTDVIADLAVDFINGSPSDEPILLYVASTGPHAPFTPAPRDKGTWHLEKLPPSVTTLTEGRAPHWPDATLDYAKMQEKLKSQHEALMSVDDAVKDIINALGPERVANTLFVYLSDNGLQFGEHGLADKYTPFSGSTEVPMYVRWDGQITPGSTYGSPVTNVDLAETIVDAAGTDLATSEGVSLFDQDRPSGVVLEGTKTSQHPAYCGWRTRRYMYAKYNSGGAELFDYRRDPYELHNVVDRPSYADRAAELRANARAACDPVPPRFSWPR